jgi:glutamine cyclotransferase
MIRPLDGKVTGRINLRGLYPYSERQGSEDVLNGIALNSDSGKLLVTGKDWPKIYEIELIPQR